MNFFRRARPTAPSASHKKIKLSELDCTNIAVCCLQFCAWNNQGGAISVSDDDLVVVQEIGKRVSEFVLIQRCDMGYAIESSPRSRHTPCSPKHASIVYFNQTKAF